jgi:aminomethyltransferase
MTGGILDDLMFANRGDHLFVVVNAACKAADIAHLTAHLAGVAEVVPVTDRALLALQGPQAEAALAAIVPQVAAMRFMDVGVFASAHGELWISRSGYTGEDGFEISVPNAGAEDLARALLAMPEVAPIGLGARDSLRLEAGLCLYGHDIDTTTTPVMAGLSWAIQKVRRLGGAREGGFPGAARILRELAKAPLGRARRPAPGRPRPDARRHRPVGRPDGGPVGRVTSGGFGPSSTPPLPWAMSPPPLPAPRHLSGRGARQTPACHRDRPAVPPTYRR